MATKTAAKSTKATKTKAPAKSTKKPATKLAKASAKAAPAKKKAAKPKAAAAKASQKSVKKAPATKAAAKKAPAAKSAKKTATAKAAPAKAVKTKARTKTAAESAAKPATAKAPATKTTKKAAKPAAAKSAVKTAATKAKTTKATKKAAPAKAAPKKKMLVGQKPRIGKTNGALAPSAPPSPVKSASPIADAEVTASPPSAEAKVDFKVNDYIVYPAHGVGRIVGIEKQLIAGVTNELFLIDFEQEKMRLRVPTGKAKAVGMRGLSDTAQIKKAIELLKGRARIKRTMWSRRAQEYEAKINSGDIISVAEVVRDLFRASDQPEQSYSERQLFEAALDRLAREVAATNKTDMSAAIGLLENTLQQRKAA